MDGGVPSDDGRKAAGDVADLQRGDGSEPEAAETEGRGSALSERPLALRASRSASERWPEKVEAQHPQEGERRQTRREGDQSPCPGQGKAQGQTGTRNCCMSASRMNHSETKPIVGGRPASVTAPAPKVAPLSAALADATEPFEFVRAGGRLDVGR